MSYNINPCEWNDPKEFKKIVDRREKLFKNTDLTVIQFELNEILFCFSGLVDHIHTLNLEKKNWMLPLEPLLLKFILHAASFSRLSDKVTFARLNGRTVESWDVGSLYLLFRALMECYLTIYYLIYSVTDDAEGEFKFKLYKASGIANRQKYDVSLAENVQKKSNEKLELDKLRIELQEHPYFSTLDAKTMKAVKGLFPPARLLSWTQLIKTSRLKTQYFLSPWLLKSNYAHSEFISVIQLQEYFKKEADSRKEVFSNLEHTAILISIHVTEILNLFPQLISFYRTNFPSSVRGNIFHWSLMGMSPMGDL